MVKCSSLMHDGVACAWGSSDDKSQSTEVASENCEQMDRSLTSSTCGLSTQRLFAAYNLADLTAGNQTEQKYVLLRPMLIGIAGKYDWLTDYSKYECLRQFKFKCHVLFLYFYTLGFRGYFVISGSLVLKLSAV